MPNLKVVSTAEEQVGTERRAEAVRLLEAMLFAWLAHERVHDRPAADVARITGARGARVLGAIYFGG